MRNKPEFTKFQKICSVLLVLLFSSMHSHSQNGLLLEDYPDSYIVKESDTLWTIAGTFLEDPEQWEQIWQPDEFLDNADLIFPGDILKISYVGGTPRVLVQRGDRSTVRLGPQIRAEALISAIPAIALESIESSFTRNRIIDPALFEEAPYIVSNLTSNLAIGTGDEVYARGVWPAGTSTFEVYREGRLYMDDAGENPLGLEAVYLGFVSIIDDAGSDLRKMLVNNSSMEMRVGDRLLIREESRIGATIYPREPDQPMNGSIVAFLNGEFLASQLDSIVINLGSDDMLEVGNILSIQQAGPTVVDEVERERLGFWKRWTSTFTPEQIQLPGKEVGTLLIYKVFEQLSYGVIISSMEPAQIDNDVVNP